MTDRPEQDKRGRDDAFEEALDAAEVFGELAEEEPRTGADEHVGNQGKSAVEAPEDKARYEDAAFADDFDLSRGVARAEAALDAAEATLLDRAPDEADELHEEPAVASAAPAPEPARAAGPSTPPSTVERQSIGLLFKTVVKHSPPSKIRIEPESVGALFRRFIEQE